MSKKALVLEPGASTLDPWGIVDKFNLSDIKAKLGKEKRWSAKKLNHAELQYRRFMRLIALYPNMVLVPNKEIDEVWHMHILDTRQYATDMTNLTGNFVHHVPGYGKKNMLDDYRQTNTLFLEHYGEPIWVDGYEPQSCGFANCNY